MEMLLRWTTKEGGVAYEDLVVLMDWRRGIEEHTLSRIAEYTAQPTTTSPSSGSTSKPATPSSKLKTTFDYKTSSQEYKATTGELPTQDYRVYGVPTVRSDLPAPRIKRVSDSKVDTVL